MLGRGNTGAALGSEAVDAEFWALICQDEEWLNTEFDAVVGNAEETPTHPPRHLPADMANRHGAGPTRWAPGGRPTVARRDTAGQALAEGARPASAPMRADTPTQEATGRRDGDVIEQVKDVDQRVATTSRLHRLNPRCGQPR